MTPTEKKAREIYERFLPLVDCGENRYTTKVQSENAKQCALICVDEILNLMIKDFKWDIKHNGNIDFWQEVKQHLNNL